jgi:diguanylate cyclase (GGDEF)-like protein/PAS domain S-box-containing protein
MVPQGDHQAILDRSALIRSRLRFARMTGHIREILDTIREPFVVLDGGLRIRLVNKSFCWAFHLSAKKVKGKSVYTLGNGAWKNPALREWLEAIPDKRPDIPDFELEGPFAAIGRRTMLFNVRRVEIQGSSRRILLLTIEDITQRKQAESTMKKINKSLKSASMTDPLTGLYNRRGYSVLSQHYLDLARRRRKKIFVIFADLDGLKQINDQGGHPSGDRALVRTAEILRKTFRKSDIIARIGGDEFAIATMENGHDSVASQIARLRKNLKYHAIQHNYGQPLSLSVGVAVSTIRGTTSIEELTSQADAVMYVEKRTKRKALATASPDFNRALRPPAASHSADEEAAPTAAMVNAS